MKKTYLFCIAALLVFLTSGCSAAKPEESTITINKDYSIDAAYVSDFDEEEYNAYLLEKEVKELVALYNSKAENKNVKLSGIEVSDNKAYVNMYFKSGEDYSRFNDEEMYAGLLSDALNNNEIDGNTSVLTLDGKLSTTLIQVLNDDGADKYKLCAISGNYTLQIKGKPMYASKDISIDENNNISVETGETAYLIYK